MRFHLWLDLLRTQGYGGDRGVLSVHLDVEEELVEDALELEAPEDVLPADAQEYCRRVRGWG